MKSLKNKKCVKCGKPAEAWLPDEEGNEQPYCIRCANSETILDSLDSNFDDDED